jgi:condensin-2 complex subunit D3
MWVCNITLQVWAHVEALTTLSKKKAVSMEQGQELVTVWVHQLLDKAGTLLQAYVSTCDSPWIQHAGVSAEKPTPLMKSGQQSQASGESQSKGKKGFETPATGRIDSHSAAFSGQVVTAIFTVGALAVVCPTAKAGPLVTILQALVIPKKSLSGKENNGSEAEGVHFLGKVSPEVCVQAWVALSKLCLADEDLAKRCIPFFFQARELSGFHRCHVAF